jgi:hypothetical protein
MNDEFRYGFVLWAIPRFHRDTAVPPAKPATPLAQLTPALLALAAGGPQDGLCRAACQ